MTNPNHNWPHWTVPALLLAAFLLCCLLSLVGCGGHSLPTLGVLHPPALEDLKPLPANAAPKDYDARISALTALLAQAQVDKAIAKQNEREAEASAWRTWTRWISALVIPLAIAGGALSLWFGFAGLGLPLAGAGILAALGLQAWAEFQAFLLIAIAVCLVLGLVVAAIAFLRRDRAAVAVAKVSDVIEHGRNASEVMAAKIEAEAAQLKAGIFARVQRARGKSTTPKLARGEP